MPSLTSEKNTNINNRKQEKLHIKEPKTGEKFFHPKTIVFLCHHHEIKLKQKNIYIKKLCFFIGANISVNQAIQFILLCVCVLFNPVD